MTSDSVRFRLNGQVVAADDAPTVTVLDWLREARRLTGTKEGCAEGDCGACTIAVARPGGSWNAVNACLMLLPQIDGLSMLTVEGLAGPDGTLHPVQQALIDADATQCGFCTPGFAMAMFAFQQGGEPAEDDIVHEALAGNLCRCTGYRPIVEACRRVAGGAAIPAGEPMAPGTAFGDENRRFFAPHSLDDLTATLAAHPDAWLLGGGTDLGIAVTKRRARPDVVISTARVPDLKRIAVTGEMVELGGAVTYTEALPFLDAAFPSFGQLVRRIGSRQIRNLGTLAGNLANASPIGDTPPCLMALQATVELVSAGRRRRVAADGFVTGYRRTVLKPGEAIATIRIPALRAGQRFAAYKLSKRFDQDISAVVAAFRLTVEDGVLTDLRAFYGGMAATAVRASHVEAALVGRPWTAASLAGIEAVVARDFSPIGDQRATAEYRLAAAANLLRRLQAETSGGPAPVRLEAL